jgi:ketosteroid isomerase-like protein
MPELLPDTPHGRSADVDLVLELHDAWQGGDRDHVHALLHPEVEFFAMPGDGVQMAFHGPDELERHLAQRDASFDVVRERVSEIFSLGDGRVAAIGRVLLATPEQKRGFSSHFCWIIDVRDGLVTRVTGYVDQDEARSAAGVTPDRWPTSERYLGDLVEGAASRA